VLFRFLRVRMGEGKSSRKRKDHTTMMVSVSRTSLTPKGERPTQLLVGFIHSARWLPLGMKGAGWSWEKMSLGFGIGKISLRLESYAHPCPLKGEPARAITSVFHLLCAGSLSGRQGAGWRELIFIEIGIPRSPQTPKGGPTAQLLLYFVPQRADSL
jgi:hypothetical protein